MPAETHTHHDAVDAPAVIDLIWDFVRGPHDADEPDPGALLAEVDLEDDLALLHLWDMVVDELAERAVAEPDLGDLRAASTVGELADVVARRLLGD
jgi:hypothetical protein